MKFNPKQLFQTVAEELSLAHRIGIGAMVAALVLLPVDALLAALPLMCFVGLCLTAPFLPGFSFFLPIVSRGRSGQSAVALTFDDGPNPDSTLRVLDLLAKFKAPATFYVNGQRAEQYPQLIRKICAHGHTIGNHTYSHDNFIMLKSKKALKKEIEKTQQTLHGLGVYPRTFRPPVGVTSPKLNTVLKQLDMYLVNFSRRAGDRGNRQVTHLARKILKKLRPDDIIMLHDTPPHNKKMDQHWHAEIERLLIGIKKMNLKIVPLAQLIERPVMADSDSRVRRSPCNRN